MTSSGASSSRLRCLAEYAPAGTETKRFFAICRIELALAHTSFPFVMEVTVDKYGRIVIPKPVRDRLGVL